MSKYSFSLGKIYMLNGALHSEDGPAIENPEGYNSWYLNGIKLNYLTFKLIMDLINE